MTGRILTGVAAIALAMTMPLSGARSTFQPDWTFKGSTLTAGRSSGQANWTAVNGELVGTPKAPEGGWLVLDKGFQDVQFGADFRCTGGCKTGVLVPRRETAERRDEGRLCLARRRRHRQLCGHARRHRARN